MTLKIRREDFSLSLFSIVIGIMQWMWHPLVLLSADMTRATAKYLARWSHTYRPKKCDCRVVSVSSMERITQRKRRRSKLTKLKFREILHHIQMALNITDLPIDVLSTIIALVGKSSDGATDVVKSMLVCKRFLEAGNSNIVYEGVCFKKIQVFSRHRMFQRTDGLLYNCASAGNLFAQFLLAQVILKSSTQLNDFGFCIKRDRLKYFRNYSPRYNTIRAESKEGYIAASFMANFTPGRGFRPFSPHWDLVKLFLCNCTRIDILLLQRDLQNYVVYFTGRRNRDGTDTNVFLHSVHSMCNMDRHKPYTYLSTYEGHFHFVSCDYCPFEWVQFYKREHPMRTVNDLVEEERGKALRDFDQVSRVFPGLLVPKQKKQLRLP